MFDDLKLKLTICSHAWPYLAISGESQLVRWGHELVFFSDWTIHPVKPIHPPTHLPDHMDLDHCFLSGSMLNSTQI